MARTYETVGWQDGSVLQPAKVTVQGTEYEVTPEVISGTTPVNATNLRKMDNEIKRIIEEDIPSVLDVELIAVSDTAPAECVEGDKYFNTTNNKIYTAIGTDTWGSETEDAVQGINYIVFETQTSYAYNGTTLVSVGGGSGASIIQQSTAPENPEEDDLWIDTTNGNALKRYNGTSWELVSTSSDAPIGSIYPFAGSTIPSDYLLCDGSAVSRTKYSDLFSAIGTTYGTGDGSTTFNLPNLKGKVPVGQDTSDTDFDTLGETGGEKKHTLTIDEMPSHNHTTTPTLYKVDNNYTGGNNGFIGYANYSGAGEVVNNNTGGGQSHNILQPYIVVNYIIKATKTTPVQSQVVNTQSNSTTDAYSCDYSNNNFTKKLETGVITTNNMTSYSVGSDTNKYYNLTFEKTYNTPPIVIVSYYNNSKTSYGGVPVSSGNITTTGCELRFHANVSVEAVGVSYVIIPTS